MEKGAFFKYLKDQMDINAAAGNDAYCDPMVRALARERFAVLNTILAMATSVQATIEEKKAF